MKTWNYRTHKARRFFRLNHAKLSKSMFTMVYYRILHTAYLKRQRYCIAAVKRMFAEAFGPEPDAWSVAYITDTEKCFVNDTITEALNNNGKIDCPECLRQMLIEIGFDVYLIQTVTEEKKPNKKVFLKWLPVKKSRELKKAVNCFWKERLPKEKLLFSLYYQMEPLKKEILATYRKILLENDTILTDTPEKEAVLAYISDVLDISVLDIPVSETDGYADDYVHEDTVENADSEDSTVISVSEPAIEQIIEIKESVQAENGPVITITEPSDKPIIELTVKPVVQENVISKVKTAPVSVNSDKKVKKTVSCTSECRGFSGKKRITKKKAVTCAVCVAAAGAMLVPLVAYAVIKHKAA